MYSSKRQKYFHIVLGFSLFFLMLNVQPASSFPQNQGANKPSAVENGSGITMKQVSGKVVETMNSGGYTYVLVEGSDATTWVALPKSSLTVGNEISCQPGMVMNNFKSSSLNRTFKEIVFSSGVVSLSSGTAVESPPAPEEETVVPKLPEPKDWKNF